MLNKHNLSIAAFSNKEQTRHTLNGILVNGESTVATNGHYLVWVSGDDRKAEDYPEVPGFGKAPETFGKFILSRDTALAIAKVTPTKEGIPILNHVAVKDDGENRVLAVTDLDRPQVFPVRPVQGQFPNWEMVMPKREEATFQIGLDAKYLAQLFKAFEGFADERTHKVVVSFYSPEKPIRIDAAGQDGQGMTAVLMPVRGTEDVKGTFGFDARQAERERLAALETLNKETMAKVETEADATDDIPVVEG